MIPTTSKTSEASNSKLVCLSQTTSTNSLKFSQCTTVYKTDLPMGLTLSTTL